MQLMAAACAFPLGARVRARTMPNKKHRSETEKQRVERELKLVMGDFYFRGTYKDENGKRWRRPHDRERRA